MLPRRQPQPAEDDSQHATASYSALELAACLSEDVQHNAGRDRILRLLHNENFSLDEAKTYYETAAQLSAFLDREQPEQEVC